MRGANAIVVVAGTVYHLMLMLRSAWEAEYQAFKLQASGRNMRYGCMFQSAGGNNRKNAAHRERDAKQARASGITEHGGGPGDLYRKTPNTNFSQRLNIVTRGVPA